VIPRSVATRIGLFQNQVVSRRLKRGSIPRVAQPPTVENHE
jgi:hypothetical protein